MAFSGRLAISDPENPPPVGGTGLNKRLNLRFVQKIRLLMRFKSGVLGPSPREGAYSGAQTSPIPPPSFPL